MASLVDPREQQLQHLRNECKKLAAEVRELSRQRLAWELRNQEIAQKWREKNQSLTRELQLAQVGLTSGCGCPVGECQGMKSPGASCWLQWAESHLASRMADIRISELKRHAVHPSRFAEARAQGKIAQRLRSPEPDGIVKEPGIEGDSNSEITFGEPGD